MRDKSKKNTIIVGFILLAVSLLLAAADRYTKVLAVQYVKPEGSISLIKFGETEALNFTYAENTGMSFSLLEGQRVILILAPVILIGLVEWYIFSGKAKRLDSMIALSVLAGGGLGNLYDRVFQGYVVDFIDVRLINFAIFNFADMCAVCGGIYFGIVMLLTESQEEKAEKSLKHSAIDKDVLMDKTDEQT